MRRLLYFLFRDRYTRELEEEMRLHLDLRAQALGSQSAARRQFGNVTNIQERSRDMWGFSLAEQVLADCRFAMRRLRRRPGFALSAIIVAALGIGATTAVFSAIDAAIVRPLPFVHPDELYALPNVNLPFAEEEFPGTDAIPEIRSIARMKDVFAHVAAYAAGGINLVDPTNPQRRRVGVVTPDFFATLGARQQLGRTFEDAEGRPKGPHSVILSDAFWAAHFGRGHVLGKSIDLSGTRYTIIGVMERGFNFPKESDVWIPLTIPTTFETFAPFRGWLPSTVIARTAPGVTAEIASTRLLALWDRATNAGAMYKDLAQQVHAGGPIHPLRQMLVGNSVRPLVILMGATLLLLLIAGANMANLLLSDAAARQREIALREVLGASRSRVTRQLLVESLVLAGIGATLGVASSPMLMRVLRTLAPASLAGVTAIELDVRLLAFATLLTIVVGVVFGLWPAFVSSRTRLTSVSSLLGIARRTLVGAELALTIMLLIGSGLMLRSLHRLMSTDTGMNPEHVGTLELSFSRGQRDIPRRLNDIIRQLESNPAIISAAAVNDLPLRGGGGIGFSIQVDGAPKPRPEDAENGFAHYLLASRGYFRTLGIPLLRGRTFSPTDVAPAPAVAVISQRMADHWWPKGDAVGKTFNFGMDTAITVIGIAADVRESSLDQAAMPQAYLFIDRANATNAAIMARSALPPATLLARMREAVRAVDPGQAVYNVRMMDQVIASSAAPRRTNTTLIALFGAVALLLSAFGVYAVVSYSVSRRAREFGIRAALGATSRDIALLVSGEMGVILCISMAAGLLAAWMLARVLQSLLFEVDTHDPATFVAAPVVLALAAMLATLIPVRRATRVSPTEVMRAE